jgi:hypothetical protein
MWTGILLTMTRYRFALARGELYCLKCNVDWHNADHDSLLVCTGQRRIVLHDMYNVDWHIADHDSLLVCPGQRKIVLSAM